MPIITLKINQKPKQSVQKNLSFLSKRVAKSLQKSEKFVMVSLEVNQRLIFGGSQELAAHVQIESLGIPDSEEDRRALGGVIFDYLEKYFEVSPDRCFLTLIDRPRDCWAYNKQFFG